MKWWLYPEQKAPDDDGVPMLAVFIVGALVIAVCIAIQAVTWPANKHVDLDFFTKPVVFPLVVMIALFQIAMIFVNTQFHYEATRFFIAKERKQALTAYARSQLAIAGWSMLTPLDEPALNMLKLEGEFPLAPKTPLKLSRNEDFDLTLVEQMLQRLLTPLVEKLKMYRQFEAVLWVRGGEESSEDELKRTLERLAIPAEKITVLTDCPDYEVLNEWMDKYSYNVVHRLVVMLDLHMEGEESRSMESASAILLTNHYYRIEGEKPVYLYRPITGVTDVESGIPVYLTTIQVESPKTLWYSGLSKVEKYPLMQTLDDRKLATNRLDIEASLGEFSAGYRWLALAMAADAVKYAQGTQLVAASEGNKLGMLALSSRLMAKPDPVKRPYYRAPSGSGGLAGFFVSASIFMWLVAFGSKELSDKMGIWSFLGILIIPMLIFMVFGCYMEALAENNAGNELGV